MFHSQLSNSETKEEGSEEQQQNAEETHVGLKRKFDNSHCSEEQGDDDSQHGNEQGPKDGKLKKAKNVGFTFFVLSV